MRSNSFRTILLIGMVSSLGSSMTFGGVVVYEFAGEINGRTPNSGQPFIGPANAVGENFRKGDVVTFTVSYDTQNAFPFTIQSFSITSFNASYSPFVSTNTDGTGNVVAVDGGNNDSLTFDTGTADNNFNSPKVYRNQGNQKRENLSNQRISLQFTSTSNPLTGNVPPPTLNFSDWDTATFQIDFDADSNFSVGGTFSSITATPEPATLTAMIALMCLGWYGFKHRKSQMEVAAGTVTADGTQHSGDA